MADRYEVMATDLTLQEQISAKALRTELEEHCVLIGHWFVRKSRTFTDCTVEVLYDFKMDWYEITISYQSRTEKDPKLRTHRVFAKIRAEDIDSHTNDPHQWSDFLNELWRPMRANLTESLFKAGHGADVRGGSTVGWYETGTGRPIRYDHEIVELPWEKGAPGVLMTWSVPRGPTKREEQEAIESIQEAMKHAGD